MDTFFDDFLKAKRKSKPVWKWTTGVVDTNEDHIKLWYGDPPHQDSKGVQYDHTPVALVARGPGKSFIVQFLLSARSSDKRAAKILQTVRWELDYYLLDVGGPKPWAYAQYHCYTAANMYSKVHWGWFPKGPSSSTAPHSSCVIRQGRRKFVFSPTRPSRKPLQKRLDVSRSSDHPQ